MAGDFKITVKGLRRLKGKLSAKAMGDAIYKGLDRWGIYLQGELGTYPPKETKTRKEAFGQTFFSDKQRRGFFAKLRSGEIRFRGSATDPGLWRVEGVFLTDYVMSRNTCSTPKLGSIIRKEKGR